MSQRIECMEGDHKACFWKLRSGFLTSKSMSCKSATRVLRSPLLYSSWASWATASVWGSFSFVPYRISFMATKFLETSSVAWFLGGRYREKNNSFNKQIDISVLAKNPFSILCTLRPMCKLHLWPQELDSVHEREQHALPTGKIMCTEYKMESQLMYSRNRNDKAGFLLTLRKLLRKRHVSW